MSAAIQHTINGNNFWLSHKRCIFWEEQKALIISDLHFGKTGHFRKEGIGVPQNIFKEDLQTLFAQIQFYQPEKLIIVGDLFHSKENKEMNLFLRWRNDISHIKIELIKGNHDILKDDWYANAGVIVNNQQSIIGNFIFVHDLDSISDQPSIFNLQPSTFNQSTNQPTNYIFSGHIHPGVSIKTGSKQSMHFPCFYFGKNYAVLPAFSKFTGLANIQSNKKDVVYAIVNQSLILVR
ncbi:MAG: metallophosphoesterase [Chitinophagaceae bacterium]